MKALVTGPTGFIGSHLVETLLDGDWEVKALVRETSDTSVFDGLDLELARGDVRDADSLRKAVEGTEIIFHVAALVGEWGAPEDFYDINVKGMENIIEAAAAGGVTRFIDVSSTSVHGYEGFDNDTEELPYVKTGVLYSDTKLEAEKLVWQAHAEDRIQASTIRPCMVWGPRDRAYMTKIILMCKSRMFSYIDGGNHPAGLAHVRNVCDVIVRAAGNEEAAGKAFIATDDCDTTVRRVVETLCDELGLKKPFLSIPYGAAKTLGGISENIYRMMGAKKAPPFTRMGVACVGNPLSFDVSRAKKVLGYEPRYRFPQGLHDYLDWFKKEYRI